MKETEAALRALLEAVAPLVDVEADIVQPYLSAWEINTYAKDPRTAAGEELHRRLTAAYERALAALPTQPA